jgi:hypothetical protein
VHAGFSFPARLAAPAIPFHLTGFNDVRG